MKSVLAESIDAECCCPYWTVCTLPTRVRHALHLLETDFQHPESEKSWPLWTLMALSRCGQQDA